jgi:glycosyltransferase involved in cell wall biosynthesis
LLLSAALIVRDEAAFLPACLDSLRGIADEVVIVDTGSADRTPEIARAAGARVFGLPWPGDFATARNAGLAACRGDWILYIDADERLRGGSRVHLERLLGKRRRAGYYVKLHPKRGYTAYWEMRLFRNHPDIRFEGVIHENIWPALTRHMTWHGRIVGYSDLVLDHEGYEGSQERKHGRNLPLLLRALEVDPTRVYCWYHLGRIYRELGQVEEARAALDRAIAIVRAKYWTEVQDSLPYVERLELGLEHEPDRDRELNDLVRESRRRYPEQAHLALLEGRLKLRQGRAEEAAAMFRWLLKGSRARSMHELAYDERMFGAWPAAGLATCLFERGNYGESRHWFEQAERLDPGVLEYRVKRQLCERLLASQGARSA